MITVKKFIKTKNSKKTKKKNQTGGDKMECYHKKCDLIYKPLTDSTVFFFLYNELEELQKNICISGDNLKKLYTDSKGKHIIINDNINIIKRPFLVKFREKMPSFSLTYTDDGFEPKIIKYNELNKMFIECPNLLREHLNLPDTNTELDKVLKYFNITDINIIHYLLSWIGLQGVVFWDLKKEYLNIDDDDIHLSDICQEKKTKEECVEDVVSKCAMFKDKCHYIKSIKEYNIGELIKNPHTNEQFKVHRIYPTNQYEKNSSTIGFISENDNKYGIFMFSSGVPFTNKQFETQKFKNIMNGYYGNIKSFINKTKIKKLLICGHSMGCFLAQYIGYMCIKNNIMESENIFIVGSGGVSWIDKENYNELTKGRQIHFTNTVLLNDNKKVIDQYIFQNTDTKKQNKTYLLSNSYDQSIGEYDMFHDKYKGNIIFNGVNLEQPLKENYNLYDISLENKQIIHNWSKYSSNLLNLIYNL